LNFHLRLSQEDSTKVLHTKQDRNYARQQQEIRDILLVKQIDPPTNAHRWLSEFSDWLSLPGWQSHLNKGECSSVLLLF